MIGPKSVAFLTIPVVQFAACQLLMTMAFENVSEMIVLLIIVALVMLELIIVLPVTLLPVSALWFIVLLDRFEKLMLLAVTFACVSMELSMRLWLTQLRLIVLFSIVLLMMLVLSIELCSIVALIIVLLYIIDLLMYEWFAMLYDTVLLSMFDVSMTLVMIVEFVTLLEMYPSAALNDVKCVVLNMSVLLLVLLNSVVHWSVGQSWNGPSSAYLIFGFMSEKLTSYRVSMALVLSPCVRVLLMYMLLFDMLSMYMSDVFIVKFALLVKLIDPAVTFSIRVPVSV